MTKDNTEKLIRAVVDHSIFSTFLGFIGVILLISLLEYPVARLYHKLMPTTNYFEYASVKSVKPVYVIGEEIAFFVSESAWYFSGDVEWNAEMMCDFHPTLEPNEPLNVATYSQMTTGATIKSLRDEIKTSNPWPYTGASPLYPATCCVIHTIDMDVGYGVQKRTQINATCKNGVSDDMIQFVNED